MDHQRKDLWSVLSSVICFFQLHHVIVAIDSIKPRFLFCHLASNWGLELLQHLWGTKGAFMWQLLQTWLMPAAVWLQSWDGMRCRAKLKFCKNLELFFQAYVVEVCSKAGKRNNLLQPVHLWKKGSFTCLLISSSKILKEFASCHIWPLFLRAEFLLPSCPVPAGFVCTVPCIPPLCMFLGCMLGWNSLHFTQHTWWCNRINPRSGLIAFPFRVWALLFPEPTGHGLIVTAAYNWCRICGFKSSSAAGWGKGLEGEESIPVSWVLQPMKWGSHILLNWILWVNFKLFLEFWKRTSENLNMDERWQVGRGLFL